MKYQQFIVSDLRPGMAFVDLGGALYWLVISVFKVDDSELFNVTYVFSGIGRSLQFYSANFSPDRIFFQVYDDNFVMLFI